jgi:hypothetical protein
MAECGLIADGGVRPQQMSRVRWQWNVIPAERSMNNSCPVILSTNLALVR